MLLVYLLLNEKPKWSSTKGANALIFTRSCDRISYCILFAYSYFPLTG